MLHHNSTLKLLPVLHLLSPFSCWYLPISFSLVTQYGRVKKNSRNLSRKPNKTELSKKKRKDKRKRRERPRRRRKKRNSLSSQMKLTTMSARVKMLTIPPIKVIQQSLSSISTKRKVKFQRRRLKMPLRKYLSQQLRDQLLKSQTTQTVRIQAVMRNSIELEVLIVIPRKEPRAKVNLQMTRYPEIQLHKTQREVKELFSESINRSSILPSYLTFKSN